MALNDLLISQFAKTVAPKKEISKENTTYGTAVQYEGATYVRIDGSDRLTPISSTTADTKDGDRVTVTIKDHQANITGNISDPSASSKKVDDISDQISEFEIIIADKITADEAVFEELRAKDASITGELTVAKATITDLQAKDVEITGKLTAVEADIKTLDAEKIDTEFVEATYATIDSLNATNAYVYNFEATYGKFADVITDRLTAAEANIKTLDSEKIDTEFVEATYATITDMDVERARIDELEADIANIDLLESDVANIETLIFGSATGNIIQTSFANAVIAQLGNAQIKSAMIENLSADKITAGDIITNNVRVMSEDGKLLISDETIQISDNTRVRVQIGKDGAGDYSINIWDADGKLMFSEGGITDNAIKEAIIRNDMVSDDANISAYKLDINSLFSAINEDGSNTIKSSRIYLNDKEQTLDVAFTEMNTTVNQNGTAISETKDNLAKAQADLIAITSRTDATEEEIEAAQAAVIKAQAAAEAAQADADKNAGDISSLQSTVSSQGTQLSVVQGKINSKVWQEDIDVVIDDVESLETRYSELDQTVDGISATVVSHSSQISNKAEKSSVTEVRDQVSNLELSLNGFKTTVSDTYATITDLNGIQNDVDDLGVKTTNAQNGVNALAARMTTAETAIDQNSTQIALRATTKQVETVASTANTALTNAANAQEDIDNLNTRVTKNESSITTNANGITALSSRVSNNEAAISELEITANGITSRVSSVEQDAENALVNAANAQSTADSKAKVFTTTPTIPYKVGDLWVQGNSGDVMKCKTARSSGSYTASDWEKASKYTDDSKANAVDSKVTTLTEKVNATVKDVKVYYAINTSSTTAPTSGWSTTPPTWENDKYVWSKTTTTLTNGTSVTTNPVCITGAKGSTGATGTGITSITTEYYLSTSKTTQTDGSWVTTQPTWSTGKYLWTRSKIVYKNPTSTAYTTPVCDSSWDAINYVEVGGRNYIKGGKGTDDSGLFKNFNTIDTENGYAEHTLTSKKQYTNVNIAPGFVLDCRDYEVGKQMVFSYDIMYTKWDFPEGSNRQEFWFGQQYTNQSITDGDKTGQWTAVTAHAAPIVGSGGCVLNEWYHVEKLITIPSQAAEGIGTAGSFQFYNSNADVAATITFRLKNVKLEYGNKATDWTPAPEDVESDIADANENATNAQETANNNAEKIAKTETLIQQLSDSISMLVVDENGTSLMKQDGDSWKFNMGSYNNILNGISSNLNELQKEVGDTQQTVNVLDQAVKDLSVISDYVIIKTYNNQPCIELGETDSTFKLRITNTEIQFVEGTTIPAYMTNQKLYINKAEVVDEMQMGGFVWKVRSNGNLGLMWKGVSS